MSWLDGLVEDNEALSQDQRLDRTSDKLKPGFFTGALDVVGPGLLRGGIEAVRTAQSAALQLGSLGIESDLAIGASFFPESEQGQIEAHQQFRESQAQEIGESTAESVMSLRPDRTEVGIAGQIIGEAMAILPRTVVGAVLAGPLGGAAAAGGPAGYSRKQVSMAEGIDESTATWLGLTEGVVTGVGAAIPMAGFAKSLVGDAALAVGANVGLGVAHRGVSAQLLEANGYQAQAAQYRYFSIEQCGLCASAYAQGMRVHCPGRSRCG